MVLKWFVSHDTNHTTKTAKRHKRIHCLEKNTINLVMIFIIYDNPGKRKKCTIYSPSSVLVKLWNLLIKQNSAYIFKIPCLLFIVQPDRSLAGK